MGEFLDSVNQRAAAATPLAHRIALYLNSPERRAVIVEAGDDQFFYAALLKRRSHRRQVEFFLGLGKTKVISTLDVLADLKKLDRSFGIVDRDFDFDSPERTHGGHCLILDVYSYENYLVNLRTIVELGKAAFGLEGGSPEAGRWELCVGTFLETSVEALHREHAEALWCRRNGRTCHLNNFDPIPALVLTDVGSVQRRLDTNDAFITQTSADLVGITDQIRDDLCVELRTRGLGRTVRGHYLTRMLVRVLNLFRVSLDGQFGTQGRSRTRTRVEISERHALEGAVNFFATPPIMEKYLDEVVA